MSERKSFDFGRHLPSVSFAAVLILAIGGLVGFFIGAGVYNIAADAPHTRPVFWLLETLRDRSIAVRGRGIAPPADLGSANRVSVGAGLYAEMCSGCHLAPGMERTEISQGLYPQAPELSRGLAHTPGEEFWVIKHGVKLTAMPAWGRTHSDDLIWDMVAFLRKLPSLSRAQYQAAVKSAPEDHDQMMQHDGPMPAMNMSAAKGHD
jgi:mono/diheme cytochrome c family protein